MEHIRKAKLNSNAAMQFALLPQKVQTWHRCRVSHFVESCSWLTCARTLLFMTHPGPRSRYFYIEYQSMPPLCHECIHSMATDHSSTSPSLQDHKMPFRLFDLPRELRDIVYSKVNAKHLQHIPRWRIVGATKPYVPALRLVSRQVKAEYEDVWFNMTALYLHQYSTMLPNLNMFHTLSTPPTIEHMYRSLQEIVLDITHNSDTEADGMPLLSTLSRCQR